MPIQLTKEALKKVYPQAPQQVLDAFFEKQDLLLKAGLLDTRNRLCIALSQIEHECGGFTIKNLTENIWAYTAKRMAQIWPSRFPNGAASVIQKFGAGPGWHERAFDSIYGNRMGNRPGTHDGSTYIGRGGPQITGRDGYENVAKRCGVPIDKDVSLATKFEYQPELLFGFWTWKNLNNVADTGGLKGVTKIWNGGYVGMADREAKFAGNDPIIKKLAIVESLKPIIKELPGENKPVAEVIHENTVSERRARVGGVTIAAGGGGAEVTKTVTTAPDKPRDAVLSPAITYTAIIVGVVIVVVSGILILKKKAAVLENWF